MRMTTKNIIAILLTLLLSTTIITTIYAADITITAEVDKTTVPLDGQLTLQVTVSGNTQNLPRPAIPAMNDFNIVQSYSSQNFSFINGAVSASANHSYVLTPKSAGKFMIPQFSINHQNQIIQSQQITIEVTQPSSQNQIGTAQNTTRANPSGKDEPVFITSSIDKNRVYVNEQLTLTFKFYTRIRVLQQQSFQPPVTNGFWAEELSPRKEYQTVYNGKRYMVTEFRTALFPTTAGKFNIGQAQLKIAVEDTSNDPFGDDFFRGFFSGGKVLTLNSEPVSVTVLPLPDNKPAGFNGTVGNYSLTAKTDKTEIKLGDAVNLILTVAGTGNIKTITEPSLPQMLNFRKYDTLSNVTTTKDNGIVHGSKTFKTVIIPQTVGKHVIPSISYSYFNPSQGNYVTKNTNPISVTVTPGIDGVKTLAGTTGASQIPGTTGTDSVNNDIKLLSTDIRHIKTGNNTTFAMPIRFNPFLMLLFILPIFAPLGTLGYQRYRDVIGKDVNKVRHSRAGNTARKQLRRLSNKCKTLSCETVSAELTGIFYQYLADKFGLYSAGLTLTQIETLLLEKHIAEDTVKQTVNVCEDLDLLRFAPGKTTGENNELCVRVEEMIKKLEKHL